MPARLHHAFVQGDIHQAVFRNTRLSNDDVALYLTNRGWSGTCNTLAFA